MNSKHKYSGSSGCLVVAAILLILLQVNASSAVCPPNTYPTLADSNYQCRILDPSILSKFVTPVVNPLAPNFIFAPAGLIAFEVHYNVSMREISQSLGLLDSRTTPPTPFPPAKVWSYGDARDDGITPYTGTAPHSFPGPTFEARSNKAELITWNNQLPENSILPVDPSVTCGTDAVGCRPFNRTVPHLHGGHVNDDSDGAPDAWFTPMFAITGSRWSANNLYGPTGTYRYDNSQEAATTWYHDDAIGLGHYNVYAGLAGFHVIRDNNELNLQNTLVLPKYPYETALAIQDRTFNGNGQLASPDKPVQNLKATLSGVPCDP